jgi:glycosyltransferase involved in cell wall biosynthesis
MAVEWDYRDHFDGALARRGESVAGELSNEREEERSVAKESLQRSYKVLMLAPTMFFADYGCHVRILEEAVILRKLGHRVTILAYPNGNNIAGLDVRRCWGVPFNYRVIVGSSRHRLYLDVMLAIKAILHVLRDRPDVIHAHLHEGGLLGWFLSKLTRVPLVFDFQGSMTSEMIDHHWLREGSWAHKPLLWLETRIDHAAPVLMTSSQHGASLLKQQFSVPEKRIYPTPDCVNADNFLPSVISDADKQQLRGELGVPSDKHLIVYLGLLAEYQGTGLLLEAIRQIKQKRSDFHLLLMGFPHEPYQFYAAQLGVSDVVSFTGKIPYELAPRYLALGDLAVAPKLSATEGSGKILNYMSMALPTAAFDTPVSREYLGDWGLYAPERSASGLAAILGYMLDMPVGERAILGERLRERVMTLFSWERVGEQMVAVYQALIDGDPLPRVWVERSASVQHGYGGGS